ncbi:hypothetical protein ACA910_020762 [Epithemia clementina (nom. ined.)]
MSSIFLEPPQTRLVTIAAHVDHGKTTLADNLIEHNGIISERLAGTLRYLDSDPEEQRRGITMRSSAIGLSHQYKAAPGAAAAAASHNNKNNNNQSGPHIIHLVDSPGHTDFSFEVSSALTACDSCLLVVDAVEGMGPRTHQVFRETLLNQLVPVLVINKMDRLCTDLGLTATEAYLRTRALLESVNAAASAMITSAHYQRQEQQQQQQQHEQQKNRQSSKTTVFLTNEQLDEMKAQDEQVWTFDPAKGNVLFCSALFGWGFTAASLARSLFKHKVVPIKPLLLRPYIFGDYKLNLETNKVLKWKSSSSSSSTDPNSVPIFALYGLQPLWDIYQGVATAAATVLGQASLASTNKNKDNNQQGPPMNNNNTNNNNNSSKNKIKADTAGMEMVLQALQVGPTGEQLVTTMQEMSTVLTKTGSNTEDSVLRALLRRYRPLASTVLDVVCEYCPSPREASTRIRSQCLSLQLPQSATVDNDTNNQENGDSGATTAAFDEIQTAVHNCDTSANAPCVAYVCKFFSTNRANLRDPSLPDDEKNLLLGLTRVLSGSLRTGQEYYLFGPKHKGQSQPHSNTQQAGQDQAFQVPTTLLRKRIKLFLLMGSSFVLVDQVPAGHLCAVLHLDDVQLKTITLSDRKEAMPLRVVERRMRPLVKVSVEAENSDDAHELDRGLLKLSLADAAVEVTATARGERILACLGEIHLEQSILDLRTIYCTREINLRTSDPIVDFGETTDWFPHELQLDFKAFFNDASPQPRQATIPPYNEEEGLWGANHGRARSLVSGRSAALSLRVVPMAESVYKALKQKRTISSGDDENSNGEEDDEGLREELLKIGKALGIEAAAVANKDASRILQTLLDCVCCIGAFGNALIQSPDMNSGVTAVGVISDNGEVYNPQTDKSKDTPKEEDGDDDGDDTEYDASYAKAPPPSGRDEYDMLQLCIRDGSKAEYSLQRNENLDSAAALVWNKVRGSAVAGFHMALRSGPICEEQVRNILVVLEGFEIAMTLNDQPSGEEQGAAPIYQPARTLSSGMTLSALRSGIRCALLTRPARLMEGYLRLTLNSSLNGLGPLYSVLSKRRGKVQDDSMVDGTDLLAITARIPQAEAFGLAPELYSKTSGEVTAPEMIFSHWQRLDVDPFWIPTTEEEREDYGELQVAGDSSTGMDNTALRYIRQVRERKGLKIDSSRTVIAAEKQRTLKR